MNSERYGKLVGDAINNCLTKRECELNALIALQQFTSRSVCMLLFACCNGNLILTLQRGVTGTARMLHALTNSSISRQVREQM